MRDSEFLASAEKLHDQKEHGLAATLFSTVLGLGRSSASPDLNPHEVGRAWIGLTRSLFHGGMYMPTVVTAEMALLGIPAEGGLAEQYKAEAACLGAMAAPQAGEPQRGLRLAKVALSNRGRLVSAQARTFLVEQYGDEVLLSS